nr:MAG TPA: hypothetical protein [Caudoviricetes sp.]
MALSLALHGVFRIFNGTLVRPLQKNTLKKRTHFQTWIKQVLKRL